MPAAMKAAVTRNGFARSQWAGYVVAEAGSRFHDATVQIVDTNYFRMLGVHPKAGRIFGGADLTADQPVVMISQSLQEELFPDESALQEVRRWVVAVIGAKSEPRITLTYPALDSSHDVAFVVTG